MRNYSTGRTGFDRVLMTVAATFLTVSSTAGFAQTANRSAAEMAIESAVPVPDTSLVPPPTAADIKPESTADAGKPADTAKAAESKATESTTESKAAESKPTESRPAEAGPVETKAAEKTTAEKPAGDEKPAGTAETTAGKPAEPVTETTASTPPAAAPAATVAAPATAEPAGGESKQAAEPAKDDAKQPVQVASKVAPADQPVADRLKDLLATKAQSFFGRKTERAAVEKFYAERGYAPLWTEGGSQNARARSVIARLKDAEADGLNPDEYPVPDFGAASDPDALAEVDLKLTGSMLDYARQAQSGQMHWSQVSGDIQYPEHPVDPDKVLANVTGASDPSAALEAYNPPHKLYKELKARLAELRADSGGPKVRIPEGKTLSLNKRNPMEDPRVPALRARLGVTENPDDPHYDETVAAAVREFQSAHHLRPDGIFGNNTLARLNGPSTDRKIDTIIVNMERWRWLPRRLGAASLGNAYAILNIPDYTLKVMQHGQEVWKTRVVVGKPGRHATPLLTETMKYITVNPTWNVPPSIIYNEYLPALQQDPTVLDRMGLRLQRSRDGSIHISQPPGERNALGRLRFNFPNKFLVYQHDTPNKNLFSRDARAYSHGCMRVQNPDQYAATLLNIVMPNEHYTPARIRAMYGRTERNIQFPTPVPVNITYQTAFVENGKLHFRKDIYGRDAKMIALLRNAKNKNLEAVIAHAQPNYSRPRVNLPQGVAYNDDRNYGGGFGNPFSGPSFFERLFGGPPAPPPPEYGHRRRIYR